MRTVRIRTGCLGRLCNLLKEIFYNHPLRTTGLQYTLSSCKKCIQGLDNVLFESNILYFRLKPGVMNGNTNRKHMFVPHTILISVACTGYNQRLNPNYST